MLPLVGLAAIGLLFMAGKFFFFSDIQADRQPIHVSVAPPDSSRVDAGESGASVTVRNPNSGRAPAGANTETNLISPPDNANRTQNSAVISDDQSLNNDNAYQRIAGSVGDNAGNVREESVQNPQDAREIIVISAPEVQSDQNSASVVSEPEQPVHVQPSQRYWMVQIGAFSTNAAAQTALRRVTQDGHRATIVSSGRWHRVMVYAGPTNQHAADLAAQLGRSGYQGAFAVPPR